MPKTYTNKTQPTAVDPVAYASKLFKGDNARLSDVKELLRIYEKASGSTCVMWNKIFGFGKYYYLDSKGGEHEFLMTGFALTSSGYTLYNLLGWGAYAADTAALGKYRLSGKSCLAVKRLDDIDLTTLQKVVMKSVADLKKKYRTEK